MAGLIAMPVTQRAAKAFVASMHRHHRPPTGSIFQIAAFSGAEQVGVVIVGRPVSRCLDNGTTAEVTRLCTNGHRNACSFLLARARAAAFALGYRSIVTYTLPEEGGASLRAAGFVLDSQTRGGSWNCSTRPREDSAPTVPKLRWCARAGSGD